MPLSLAFDTDFYYLANPVAAVNETFGLPFILDATQEEIVCSRDDRVIVNCCRQWGKTSTTAAKVAYEAAFYGGLILVIAPVERQAKELFRKVKDALKHYRTANGSKITFIKDAETTLELSNGARIVALPAKGENIRGFTNPSLIVIDEAAFVQDEDYRAIRPMLSHGARLIVMSTPFGKRGWFYETWRHNSGAWKRYSVSAADCTHISRAFLDDERQSIGLWWYAQEYDCQFLDSITGFFNMESVRAGLDEGIKPLFSYPQAIGPVLDSDIGPLFA